MCCKNSFLPICNSAVLSSVLKTTLPNCNSFFSITYLANNLWCVSPILGSMLNGSMVCLNDCPGLSFRILTKPWAISVLWISCSNLLLQWHFCTFFLICSHNRKHSGKRWFLQGAWKDIGQVRQRCKLCKKYLMFRKWWGRKLKCKTYHFGDLRKCSLFQSSFRPQCAAGYRERENGSDGKLSKHLNGGRRLRLLLQQQGVRRHDMNSIQ